MEVSPKESFWRAVGADFELFLIFGSHFLVLSARCLFGLAGELLGSTGALFGPLGGRSERLMNFYNRRGPTFR